MNFHTRNYGGGVVDYLEVLDFERNLFNAKLDLSVTRRQYLNAMWNFTRCSVVGGHQLRAGRRDE